MGFYKNRSDESNFGFQRRKSGVWRWAGVVVLSALVGSGATLAVTPILANNRSLTLPTAATAGNNVPTGATRNVSVNVNDNITNIVKKVEPDVVAVVNYTSVSNFFSQQSQLQESDIGSGVFFYEDGNNAYIVTNNHVVNGGKKVEIVLQSGKHVDAQIVGTDPYTDLAVLKVPVSTFKGVSPAQFANSSDIQVGEPAVAIGTPMGLNFADSVTSGIVSGKQRMMPVQLPDSSTALDYQPVIQTDAAINPGNSGGPLLNVQGQVIGINSSKIVAQGFSGMGFAIPANEVQTITSEIMKNGHAVHPALGIGVLPLSAIPQYAMPNVPVNYGVYVVKVDSQQAKAGGLQKGDVIVALNGKAVKTEADLRTALFQAKPGQQVKLTVYRGTQRKVLTVTVGTENTSALNQGGNSNSGSNPYGIFGGQNPFGP